MLHLFILTWIREHSNIRLSRCSPPPYFPLLLSESSFKFHSTMSSSRKQTSHTSNLASLIAASKKTIIEDMTRALVPSRTTNPNASVSHSIPPSLSTPTFIPQHSTAASLAQAPTISPAQILAQTPASVSRDFACSNINSSNVDFNSNNEYAYDDESGIHLQPPRAATNSGNFENSKINNSSVSCGSGNRIGYVGRGAGVGAGPIPGFGFGMPNPIQMPQMNTLPPGVDQNTLQLLSMLMAQQGTGGQGLNLGGFYPMANTYPSYNPGPEPAFESESESEPERQTSRRKTQTKKARKVRSESLPI